jgi:hypothetical protein
MVNAYTNTAAVTTEPLPAIERMMPARIFSLNRETASNSVQ